ncbi:hypothetical protein NBX27_06410 [Erysipelothrix rhusiopathiae]|uniref:hypothetical protein n=1 Tax=Erysipelothrix rhusiopathiae TaxID=1648 RepID=UPI00202B6ED1|nr:hypothetical protein [Erysipelothrix rhusiopathiae]URQ76883.1 hypothetical protein NBX27_06410 [Erysipelothrix rhusiopathiae]
MKYNCYYYENEKKVIISALDEKPNFEDSQVNDLRINISTKEVEKIFDFFKFITVNAIMNNDSAIEIDYQLISQENFYQEDSFVKLKELFDSLITIANETLGSALSAEATESE